MRPSTIIYMIAREDYRKQIGRDDIKSGDDEHTACGRKRENPTLVGRR